MSSPWLKWYPSDWRADPRLRMCSIGARGLWMEMLCLMHEAEPYGHLLVGPVPVTPRQLASLAGIPQPECMKFLLELESSAVYSRTDEGTIYSRRMVRDKAKAEKDRENGKGGGNPKIKALDNGGVNPKPNPTVDVGDKAQKLEARNQSKDSEADASGADAPIDHRKRLFDEGLPKLARMTGKGPDSCRSFVGKCLKAAGDDAVTVLGLIEDAERNQAVDPSGWIAARLKPQGNITNAATAKASILTSIDRALEQSKQEDANFAASENTVLSLPSRSIR